MSAGRFFLFIFALAALGMDAGCGGRETVGLTAETDDSLYQQGKQLQRGGRHSEALATFLKVIERRGEQASPESHLEAGLIYFQHIKEPVEAMHHFRQYLRFEPNSRQAPMVRQQIDSAKRELFRTMPGRPSDDQVSRFSGQEAIERLQRENDDLRVEIGRLRGVAPTQFLRTTRGPVEAVEPLATRPPVLIESSPVKLTPTPSTYVAAPAPAPASATPASSYGGRQTPSRPGAVPTKTPPTTAVSGKRHTVAAGEGLYRIGLKYGVKSEAIAAANPEVLTAGVGSKLTPGMVLKIP